MSVTIAYLASHVPAVFNALEDKTWKSATTADAAKIVFTARHVLTVLLSISRKTRILFQRPHRPSGVIGESGEVAAKAVLRQPEVEAALAKIKPGDTWDFRLKTIN